MKFSPEDTVIIFSDNLRICSEGKVKASLSLFRRESLKEAILRMALSALDEGLSGLFPHVCGRCGRCCEHFDVFVGASEIYRIRSRLGMGSDDEFRLRYLKDARTWNPFDGYLIKEKGACPFLRKASRSRPASCKVWAVRPGACAGQMPNLDICRKDPYKLCEHIESMRLHGGALKIIAEGGRELDFDNPSQELKERIRACLEQIGAVEDTRSAKVENIVADAHAMLESILASPHSSGDRAAEVRDLLFNITQWLALRPSDYLRVEELWEKFRKVELLASGSIDAPSQDGEETDEYLILLTPMSAACIGKESSFSFNYSDSPDLLKAVRDLVREAALYYSDDLQEAITEPAPQCTMCGECCGRNRVEITPYDVEGLSDHLGVSEDTFRRRYTQPTPFSWSTGRVIFRQKDGKCVFIRKTGEGLLACSIYERRPQICRSYGARSRLCFQANLGEYWHRRAGTIVGITVGNGEILVASVNTIDRGSPPIRIREDPSTPLGAQIRRLRRAIRLRNPAPGNQSPANPAYR